MDEKCFLMNAGEFESSFERSRRPAGGGQDCCQSSEKRIQSVHFIILSWDSSFKKNQVKKEVEVDNAVRRKAARKVAKLQFMVFQKYCSEKSEMHY